MPMGGGDVFSLHYNTGTFYLMFSDTLGQVGWSIPHKGVKYLR